MLLLFLSFRAVTNHGPKDNPLPGRVSSEQILNGKESLSCTFPAGGLLHVNLLQSFAIEADTGADND